MPANRKTENHFKKIGCKIIAGIDEVGVGPLAGPVLAAAVILNKHIKGIDDSKKIRPKKRFELYKQILKNAISIGIGIVDEKTIDKINILKASLAAMRLALEALEVAPDFILVDGRNKIKTNIPQKSIIKGDAKCYCIAAASIVAKVLRDNIMAKYHLLFPEYGFNANKGYGTKGHFFAINNNGASPIHRQSFLPKFNSPVAQIPLDFNGNT
ncbi:MAG: ribonuclease HII [Candidatus Saganbacteria bacterium]|uniref:Ribonuclease HII n=1 Tax=Candidatus Saganbacteria bacterium TaxID=2575572 RepID=A0A833P3C5_UNCSA|nr:MAG: ribonuclease HII [Candidatus Saganbacteria bacterium]